MKKTVAFFLLCVYLLIQATSLCWYFYKPLVHSYFLEQSKNNPVKDLVSISIDRNKLNELKNDEGEIVIDGILYDVEMSASSGNMIKLLLKRDRNETNWNNNYNKTADLLYKKTNDGHTTPGKILFSLVPLFYSKETTAGLYLVKYLYKISPHSSPHFYPRPVKELVTPPPRLC